MPYNITYGQLSSREQMKLMIVKAEYEKAD